MKIGMSFAAIFLTASILCAQTATNKPSQASRPPNTNAPTKVTGDGVKMPSGLQYWDIKAGTGPEAKKGDHVKAISRSPRRAAASRSRWPRTPAR